MRRKNSYLLLLTLLICTRCATVSAPTGGAKDEITPRVISSTIENASTNFTGNSIILTFTEFIKLDNPSQNVYSSPPLGNTVSFVTKKNKLFIIFQEDLEENTTYHLNFGNSIKDVNESNPLNNYHFVFATGDAIDSLSYQGRITSINDAEITENTLIGLYKEADDSAFLKHPPFYFTFVEDNGNFVLDYLKPGEYSVFALTDRNTNYYYDLPNEAIGFLDSTLVLNQNSFLANIPLFVPEENEIRVKSFTTTISDYKIEHEINRSIPDEDFLSVEVWGDSTQMQSFFEISEDRKKITTWVARDLKNQSSAYSVLKWNDEIVDTFQHSIAPLEFPKLTIQFSTLEMTKNDSLIISLSNPMDTPCLNIAIIDTLNKDEIAFNAYKLSDFQLVARPEAIKQTNVVYTLLTPLSCFSDIYGQKIKIPETNFKFIKEDERGTLLLKFEGVDTNQNYIIKLLDSQKKIIESIHLSSGFSNWDIANLKPGNYALQIIEDANKNGVWNSGSLIPRKHPEKIYTYPKEFVLRPNWELEESVNLNTP